MDSVCPSVYFGGKNALACSLTLCHSDCFGSVVCIGQILRKRITQKNHTPKFGEHFPFNTFFIYFFILFNFYFILLFFSRENKQFHTLFQNVYFSFFWMWGGAVEDKTHHQYQPLKTDPTSSLPPQFQNKLKIAWLMNRYNSK